MKQACFAIVSFLLVIGGYQSASAEKPIKDWTREDFERQGEVVTGPVGVQREQLKLMRWTKPTLLDLRKSQFLANEDGPFVDGKLPKEWPTGEAFKQLSEASEAEKYPLALRGGPAGVFVLGGTVIGRQPRELPWRFLKRSYDGDAVRVESSGEMVVDGLYAENIEDVVSPRGSGFWTVRGVYGKYVRDDFVENDGLLSGEIIDCLVDGCHVLVSARPGAKAAERAIAEKINHPPKVTIRDTLCHVEPLPYDGDMKLEDRETIVDGKAGGKLFKWSPAGGTLEVENCVFRVDVISPQGAKSMSFPEGSYRNVTLVWLGAGDYPAPVPEGMTVTRDVLVWDRARSDWLKKHGYARGE
jgi:hypothetical protein